MQDKIIILKNTKNGIVKDTIMSVKDTLRLSLENVVKLRQPEETLVVKTISEPLSGIEVFGLWVAAILAVLGIVHIVIQLNKLLKNDNELQSQINELVKLNHLFERRLRMTVKPHIFQNGSGYQGTDRTMFIHLNNRGEICFYKGFEVLEGEGSFWIQEWQQDMAIEKNKHIQLTGSTTEHPTRTYFKIKVLYYDRENYQYETIIEWNNSRVSFLETKEL